MSTIRQPSMSLLLAATLFGAAATAHAGVSVSTMVAASAGYQTDYGTPSGNTVSSTLRQQNATSSGYASSYADYGVLKSIVSGYGTAGSTSSAVAGASFVDFLTISNPELNGKVGAVTLSFYYDYELSLQGNGEYPVNVAGGHYSAYASMYGYNGNTYSSQINEAVSNNGSQTFSSITAPPASARYRSPNPDSATSTRCPLPPATARSPDCPMAPGRRCRCTCPARGRP
jgi:hypothetical protein